MQMAYGSDVAANYSDDSNLVQEKFRRFSLRCCGQVIHLVLRMRDQFSFSKAQSNPSESRFADFSDSTSADYYQFNNGESIRRLDLSRASYKPTDLEIVQSLGPSEYEFSENDLKNAKSTAARLTFLEKLSASGIENFKFKDKDGTEREFRVETQKSGDKTLIHCYGKDAEGEEQIVMRAARNASGELEPQRNKDGEPVSYYGDKWSRSMQNKTYLLGDRNGGLVGDTSAKRHDYREDGVKRRPERDQDRARGRGQDRDPDRDRENERDKNRDRRIVRDEDRPRERRSREYEEKEVRRPRVDIGRALADVASIAAPFLMAHLSNRERCSDNYPYRDYPRYLPERGCGNYFDNRDEQRYYHADNRHHHQYQRQRNNFFRGLCR